MHKLVKKVASKNIKLFDTFREAHPDCKQYHSKYSDQYHKIIYESMGGKGDNDFEKHEKIIKNVLKKTNAIVVSRIPKKNYQDICNYCKKNNFKISTGQNCTTIMVYNKPLKKTKGKIGIITAGTSDIGIAEESRLMCEAMNCNCITSYDVGIAGLHRIFPVLKEFVKSGVDAIIVVAGMEGALASVVSSTVNVPIIGVPTSIGYGYGEKGVAALAAMLQSCSLGLTVVNIDNGIGAGAAAAKIVSQINKR